MLSKSNYAAWAIKVKVFMKAQELCEERQEGSSRHLSRNPERLVVNCEEENDNGSMGNVDGDVHGCRVRTIKVQTLRADKGKM